MCVSESGTYELVDWPPLNDHSCWADENRALIRKAPNEIFEKVSEDPSRSINQIYEEVRNSTTQNMESQKKLRHSIMPVQEEAGLHSSKSQEND